MSNGPMTQHALDETGITYKMWNEAANCWIEIKVAEARRLAEQHCGIDLDFERFGDEVFITEADETSI